MVPERETGMTGEGFVSFIIGREGSRCPLACRIGSSSHASRGFPLRNSDEGRAHPASDDRGLGRRCAFRWAPRCELPQPDVNAVDVAVDDFSAEHSSGRRLVSWRVASSRTQSHSLVNFDRLFKSP